MITSVSFDISGCVQCWVTPQAKDGTEMRSGNWFDVQRLDIDPGANRVMSAPDFDARGPDPRLNDSGPAPKGNPHTRTV